MSGIYIHIPFCRQKCHYCNFHFSVSLKNKASLLNAILKEIDLNHHYLDSKKLDTIYLGGGTPSILNPEELNKIIQKIKQYYSLNPGLEFTLEVNPDDLNPAYLDQLLEIGINRLSIGTQSFIEEELKMMNRSHTTDQASKAIQWAKNAGFEELTIDLIFGMPQSTMESWKSNLETAVDFDIPHLSCYNLTIEAKTALHHILETGKLTSVSEELMADQFLYTIDFLEKAGYEHYEISNYAKQGKYAKHNTAYWQGATYLGIGPSAHSYNGNSRQWNIASNSKYIKSLESGIVPYEKERLSREDIYNEYIMTGLRTQWGCELDAIEKMGEDLEVHFLSKIINPIEKDQIIRKSDRFLLTNKGKLFSDEVAASLFM